MANLLVVSSEESPSASTLRGGVRRRARTVGTTVQIGLAVGVAIGFLTLGITIANVTAATWDAMNWDVLVIQRGSADLDDQAGDLLANLDGVETVHPTLYNGTTSYPPLATFQGLLGHSDTNTYWVRSASRSRSVTDQLAASAEDALNGAGYPVRTEICWVEREANLASNRALVNVLAVMGVPIVAIGMIGLVNLMTMNVIERTRGIGILRCIGAHATDIRRIFRWEAETSSATQAG